MPAKISPGISFFALYWTLQRSGVKEKIGVTGFEPATSRPPAERATKLRHTPISKLGKCY